MRNPWTDLPRDRGPFVLPSDSEEIERFNVKRPHPTPSRLDVADVIPEPFVGNVLTAPVVVLMLNPGSDDSNARFHAEPAFRKALLANLIHQPSDWPFYFLDPRFRETQPGGIWWAARTRRFAEQVEWERVAERLAVVEWFPYKSKRFAGQWRLESQKYGFWLVQQAMNRNAWIVLARARRRWFESVSDLSRYKRLLTLSSNQAVYLSEKNLKWGDTKQGWSEVVAALK